MAVDLSPGATGVLRAGKLLWLRSLGWMLLLLVVTVAILSLQSVVGAIESDPGVILAMAFVCTGLAYAAYVGLVRWGERRWPAELAWRRAAAELLIGVAIGAALFSIAFAILWVSGAYVVVPGVWNDWPHDIRETLGTGLLEELIARAILFRLLGRAFGLSWAFALSAALFGAAHLGNANASAVAALAIAVEAGLLLAGFYALTGRIWVSIGAHAAWNFTQGAVFGARVSGMEGSGSLFVSHPAADASTLWSGGGFGPEASMPAVLVGLLAFLLTVALIRRRSTVTAVRQDPIPANVLSDPAPMR